MRIVSLIALLFLLCSCAIIKEPRRDQGDVLDFYEVEKVIYSGNSDLTYLKKLLNGMGIENHYADDNREQSKYYYAITKKGEYVFIASPAKEKYNTYSIPFPFPKFDEVITEVEVFNDSIDIKEIVHSDISLEIYEEEMTDYTWFRVLEDDLPLESPYSFIMAIGSIYINSKFPGTTYVYIYAISETEFAFIHDYEGEPVILWEFTID